MIAPTVYTTTLIISNKQEHKYTPDISLNNVEIPLLSTITKTLTLLYKQYSISNILCLPSMCSQHQQPPQHCRNRTKHCLLNHHWVHQNQLHNAFNSETKLLPFKDSLDMRGSQFYGVAYPSLTLNNRPCMSWPHNTLKCINQSSHKHYQMRQLLDNDI